MLTNFDPYTHTWNIYLCEEIRMFVKQYLDDVKFFLSNLPRTGVKTGNSGPKTPLFPDRLDPSTALPAATCADADWP